MKKETRKSLRRREIRNSVNKPTTQRKRKKKNPIRKQPTKVLSGHVGIRIRSDIFTTNSTEEESRSIQSRLIYYSLNTGDGNEIVQ